MIECMYPGCSCASQTYPEYREKRNIDECALGLDDCGVNQYCVDIVGSYLCFCIDGFVFDGQMCVSKFFYISLD